MQKQSLMQQFQISSYLSDNNAAYIEALYDRFLKDPRSVAEPWQRYFQTLFDGQRVSDISHQSIRQQFRQMAIQPKIIPTSSLARVSHKQNAVDALIEAYRRFGHLNARLDPLNVAVPADARLQLNYYDLTERDLEDVFDTHQLLEQPNARLKDIFAALQKIYCGSMGIEYSTIANEQERIWLQEYVERRLVRLHFSPDIKKNIL